MKKISIQLEELGCPSCVKKIENALKRQEGIGEVNILFNSSKAKIEYDEAVIESDKVVKIISDLGYEVLSVK